MDPRSDGEHLAQLLDGHITTQLIAAAVRFGIPDLLGEEVVAVPRLSAASGIRLAELPRFLYALQRIGLVEAVGAGEFKATPMMRHLRSGTGGLHGHALMAGKIYYDVWADLDHTLRTGGSAFDHHGGSLWDHLAKEPETAAAFTRTMNWNTGRILDELTALYPFPETGIIADLGAGEGTVTAGLAERLPGAGFVVFEQPSVIGNTRRALAELGVADRCSFVSGDFLEQVPPGADLYLLKSVLHNWGDPAADRILRNCRAAMAGRGRLLVIEHAADSVDPVAAAMRDMIMLVLFGGRDRTVGEYGALLEAAGFEVSRTWSGSAGLRLLEAVPR
ncbi:methyltransferase [Kitasatospora viridis]|uniref:O-methyltransferase n=1 Tax=Kitasatospora viridis TaxID=281105 RepID=A0A561UBL3_9ACTN|nr:methyltransferase [Kitasatospora viridis]TWF96745.1 O-methyltransferase [Kitasatospora viridis]